MSPRATREGWWPSRTEGRVSISQGPAADCRVCGRAGHTWLYAEGPVVTPACQSCSTADLAWPALVTPPGADGVPLVPGAQVELRERAPGIGAGHVWREIGAYLGPHLAEYGRTRDPEWLTSAHVREWPSAVAGGCPISLPVAHLRTRDESCPPHPHAHPDGTPPTGPITQKGN